MHVLVTGTLVGLGAALLSWLGGGIGLTAVALLGTAAGACLVLIDDGPVPWRVLGFFAGLVAAWLGYLLRALVLPDSDGGRALAVLVVVLICTGVALLRVPLWAPLLGALAMVGSYEETYIASPPDFKTQSVTALTTLIAATAIGVLAGTVSVRALRAPRYATAPAAPAVEGEVRGA